MTAGRVDLTPAGGVMVDAEALRMLLAKHDVARVTYTAALHKPGVEARIVCRCLHEGPADGRTNHLTDVLIHHTEVWLIEPGR